MLDETETVREKECSYKRETMRVQEREKMRKQERKNAVCESDDNYYKMIT